MFTCEWCGQQFSYKRSLNRHILQHKDQKLNCMQCNYETSRKDNLRRHLKGYHKLGDAEVKVIVGNGVQVYEEQSAAEQEVGEPSTSVMTPSIDSILDANSAKIDDYEKVTNRYQDLYNFRMTNPTTAKLVELSEQIFNRQEYAYKLNMSFGYVLYNHVTDEHQYYYASTNNRLLRNPIAIRKREDLEDVARALDMQDILEYCKLQRPNTRYIVERITNVLFYVNKVKPFRIGCGVDLPSFIRNKKSIVSLTYDRHTWLPYTDNFCLFRCMAYHSVGRNYEAEAARLVKRYCTHQQIKLSKFKGVTLDELLQVENLFSLNIEVYELVEERTSDGEMTVAARKVHSSRKLYDDTVNVNLYENHFSYIQNLKKYSRQWSCRKCRKLFAHQGHADVHERRCQETTTFQYVGGGYGPPKSIFELLEEHGCEVQKELVYYPYRMTFDFEAFSEPVKNVNPDAKLKFTGVMVPASVSICSNVPGYESPQCFISDGNVDSLMDKTYSYMVEISTRSLQLLMYRYEDIISWLNEKVEEVEDMAEELSGSSDEDEDMTSDDDEDKTELIDAIYRGQIYKELAGKLDVWLRRIPAIGFNCGKYDVNLVRKYLFPYMLRKGVTLNHIIKKGNDYLAISTDHFVILDMKNFIAPGVSYAKFLQSMGVETKKGFWPHDWFQGLDKLQENKLVPQDKFWSKLKNEGIGDADYLYLKQVWKDNNFTSMADLLQWYNNLDTQPFVTATEKFHENWRKLGVDAYKSSCISLPGLSLQLLTMRMQPHTILPVMKNEEHFNLVKENIVGGLSVVMHRYHEAGVTKLPNGELVARIYSHDCNSLYLWALGEEMGTGIYAVWEPYSSHGVESMKWERSENCDKIMQWHDIKSTNEELMFHREGSYPRLQSQTEWLEYVSYIRGIPMEHKFNGREKVIRVSNKVHYPVDGYHRGSNTVFQFHGCYFHGHGCGHDNERDDSKRKSRYDATMQIEQKIRTLGYDVEVIWECEWIAKRKADPDIDSFLEDNIRLKIKSRMLSGGEILQGILSEDVFGLLEVDVEVPWWNEELLSYYEEFPPVYKNTYIGLDDIHGMMKRYAVENGLLSQPRKYLINSFFARKALISSPLLKWYLENDLVVTRIYRLIEMKPKRCFQDLRQEITVQRRKGDEDPKLKPQTENWKLVGNSCYGKTVTNKLMHKETIVAGDGQVAKHLNDKRFSKMDEAGPQAYEISMDKKKIVQDLPVTIGYFVYNASKLKMLQFVYGFLKKYLMPGSFQMICSDTDSIIAAYQDENLDNLVRPEMREQYFEYGKKQFLVVDKHGMREPGLFKVEKESHGAIALCSKTYFTWNTDDKSVKLSTKGLSKRTNAFTKEDFMDVLTTRMSGSGVNLGMRLNGQDMMHYQQERMGLSYFYIKRHVENDGISTRSLDL